jgi:amino acid transporter
MNDLFAD